ncbi:LemA family protein [Parasphingorhabdus sp.]|uniref:LemA family protein n=1 Tax=Parasphingorhabdus sp. TaxID=2709688 RepID=UPI003A94852A
MLNKWIKFLVVPVAALALSACGINSVPTAEENAKAKWADVESSYQRRADLIPNLVETVKGYATQEQDTLTKVTEARAKATSIQVNPGDLNNAAAMQNYMMAQDGLSQALSGMRVIVEKYPDLKSNQNFLALQSQLEGTENRINVARRDYNEAVREYNTTIRTFPDIIGAKIIHGAKPMTPFQATEGADKAPEVKF